MLVVNLFAGPGAGKSTTAAAVFSELKQQHINCELVSEFAKAKVWEKSTDVLKDQIFVFGQQFHKQFVLEGQVDVLITDSPLLLSSIYHDGSFGHHFDQSIIYNFRRFNNLNFYLERVKPFNPKGRMQGLDAAKQYDQKIKNMLDELALPYHQLPGDRDAVAVIVDAVINSLSD
jgi:hypothetical protein